MEFFEWGYLATYAGATLAVGVLTQLTKELPGIRRIPTRLWCYALSLATLLLAQAFSGAMSASGAVLCLFNAAQITLSANGGYDLVESEKTSE